MLNNQKIIVVLPAYNASKTLAATVREIPYDVVDDVVLVDDSSEDDTVLLAGKLKIAALIHSKNSGYGANQKTCYAEALKRGADIIIMVHPDYQYTPRLVTAMAAMIAYGEYDVVLASRILGKGALRGGMPLYKYFFNRLLTFIQNVLLSQKFSEYHTGFRAFRRDVLKTLPLLENSNDFIFDNEIIAQMINFGFRVGELSCPTRYAPESSSINFTRSAKYGVGVLLVSIKFFLNKYFGVKFAIFEPTGRRLLVDAAGEKKRVNEK